MEKEFDISAIIKHFKNTDDKIDGVNRTLTALTVAVGQIRQQESPQPIKAVCDLSARDSASINDANSLLRSAIESLNKHAEEMRKKRIFIQGTLLQKLSAIISGTLLMGAITAVILYFSSPAYLAGRLYRIMCQEDIRNPGWYYHDAYSRIKAGERNYVKSEIKLAEINLQVRQKAAAILEPLLDNRPIFVHHVERDSDQPEALVTFRYKDNDVIWKAYFLPDGAVCVTDAEKVNAIYDARKYFTSKKVKWEKVR